MPDSELTQEARGGVQVPAAATAGAQVTVVVLGHPGEQVRIWLHSNPTLLATVTLNADGQAVVTIPAGSTPGQHRIVVQAMDGTLIGWGDIQVAAAAKADPAEESLPVTGPQTGWPALGMAIALMVGGAMLARRRRYAQQ
ncbi:MAG: LPXTG cell wall anchor domain-containing protein [Bifidobacteriaceae bacterium]|nr:LPXTG cell wall anchor domain-containing protein [Bifidobacteriaceae bacterium]